MGVVAHLRRLADNPKYTDSPPSDFAMFMGMRGCSQDFVAMAWQMFRETRKPVTMYDVQDRIKKQRVKTGRSDGTEDMEVGCIDSHFLDSGAFTLWTLAEKYGKEHNCDETKFYYTREHWDYIDQYAEFVKANRIAIDLYANVDAIGHADLTYRNQKYLEKKHGLKPVPVVHYPTDLNWLRRYMDEGYDLIGLGGLVGHMAQDSCRGWIDRCFDLVCDQPSRLPKVRLHGFGVTSYELMIRYPWWSVDSTSWTKIGAFGSILVPHKRGDKFVFTEQPYTIKVAWESPSRKGDWHIFTVPDSIKVIIDEWLDLIGIPLGKVDRDGNIIEYGVITRHTERRSANLLFFEQMRSSLPEYPWPFRSKRRKGFGVV
jgi:hypothetical protein